MNKILVVDDDKATCHMLKSILTRAGFSTAVAGDGLEALKTLGSEPFDLMLLDVWMPRMNGLELLAKLRAIEARPRVVVMTSDDAPETLLKAVREQAINYVHKPVQADQLLETVREALAVSNPPRVDVISARPEWVELVVPCTREAAGHIEAVMSQLDADLAPDVRASIGYAFRELLLNAVEWGGKLDPSRTVRIACLRAKRMIMYRIADPGTGFNLEDLPHAAVGQPSEDPIAHMEVREAKGIRPGGFGLLTVRASVDELLYNEQRNEVVFVKYLDEDPASH
ncbi:MAG TPA: response regulator [Vicinamibacterales bacterium]|jgi:CheY-like chemotaxis protein/anti-sigma regulatory factor (Ser/Thr protein kinase)